MGVADPVPANPRRHGAPPYRAAAVHGGPGAAGELEPLARELASGGPGILEPFQTRDTPEGQVEELSALLTAAGAPPLTLVGFSWGAWLALLTAARHPELVGKLILVGCAPLEERFAAAVRPARLRRLAPAERADWERAEVLLADAGATKAARDAALARLGALAARTDAVDPLPADPPPAPDAALYAAVWPRAAALRKSGELLARARAVRCPVTAIHGADDPHPADGVRRALGDLPGFRFHALPACGHAPWRERLARDAFFALLRAEV